MSSKEWETVKIINKMRPGEDHGLIDGCNDSVDGESDSKKTSFLKMDHKRTHLGQRLSWNESKSSHVQRMQLQVNSIAVTQHQLGRSDLSAQLEERLSTRFQVQQFAAASEMNIPVSVAYSPNRPRNICKSLSSNALNSDEASELETVRQGVGRLKKVQHLEPLLLGEVLNQQANANRTSQELPLITRAKVRTALKVTIRYCRLYFRSYRIRQTQIL